MKGKLQIGWLPFLCVFSIGPVFGQGRIVIYNKTSPVYMVMANGVQAKPIYLVVDNPAANAITLNGGVANGGIISELEYNMVQWDIGKTAASYTIPFQYSTTSYIPVTFNTTAGAGNNNAGVVKFSTYHGTTSNCNLHGVNIADNACYEPSDVGNMDAMYSASASPTATDNSYNVVDRFWIVDAYTGYPTAHQRPDPVITFTYLNSGNANSEVANPNNAIDGSLIAQRWNTTKGWGDYTGQTGTTAAGVAANTSTVTTGTSDVTSDGFYRSWTLSSSSSPLPVGLTSFTAECNNYYAVLKWSTSSESNNDYFTVERTQDGNNFETVATVKGAGTTSTPNNYSAIDYSPFTGTSYYRLSQTDLDGTTRNIGTAVFVPCESEENINAFASNGNIINIQINAVEAGAYQVTLMNDLGQVVLTTTKNAAIGLNEYKLQSQVANGIYLLRVIGNDKVYTRKLALGGF